MELDQYKIAKFEDSLMKLNVVSKFRTQNKL